MTPTGASTPMRLGPLLGQTVIVYAAATLVLAVYGVQVCPFLESLEWKTVALVLAGGFSLAVPVRMVLLARLFRSAPADAPSLADLALPRRVLVRDLLLWCGVGLALMVFDTVVFGFPPASGMKVVIGCAVLGLFGATELTLRVEAELMERIAAHPAPLALAGPAVVPLSRKLLLFFSGLLPLVAIVLVLLLKKDFDYLASAPVSEVGDRFVDVAVEVLFVLGTLLLGNLLVARRFAANMNALFGYQLRAMDAVTQGHYDVAVPVVSRDEMNLIAHHTNRMIEGLREKDRIKSAFGKYMSPQVAKRILDSEEGAQLGGRSVEVAVLFTDIRGFTPLSEGLAPAALVSLLNEYFTMIVSCVHDNGGVLDKFIGDAAMAVFGLDEREKPCARAVSAAFAMREGLVRFNASLAARGLPTIDNGIGVHIGPVLAGNIGSAERLEYTVIGDSVNIASRIESATKELGAPVVISQDVYARLDEGLRARFRPLGEHALKGKSRPIALYGGLDAVATAAARSTAPAPVTMG